MTSSWWTTLTGVVDTIDVDAQRISWSPDRWDDVSDVSGDARTAIRKLRAINPNSIARADVRAVCAAEGPVAGFVAAMIWGFGPTGYGPHRLHQMLTAKRGHTGPDEVIVDIMEVAARQGAGKGFSALWASGRTRVLGLGTAFGTKALHFATNESTPGAPPAVLDMFVFQGARKLEAGGWGENPVPDPDKYLTGDRYGAYCDWLAAVAEKEGVDSATVEFGLFQLGKDASIDKLDRR